MWLGATSLGRAASEPDSESLRSGIDPVLATAWVVTAAAGAIAIAAYVADGGLVAAIWWFALATPAAMVISWFVGATLAVWPAPRRARGRLTTEKRRKVAGVAFLWILALALVPVGVAATIVSDVDPRMSIPLTLLASYAAMWTTLARVRHLKARPR